MKIRVESEKIIHAVKKLNGIEVVLETPEDAKEAINLILGKIGLLKKDAHDVLKDIRVTSSQRYETSAVTYRMIFLLEFLFEEEVPLNSRVDAIREFQEFLEGH